MAVAVPLFLGDRPVDQRFVLIGVTASAFFFEFLQAAAVVRYGTTGYDEGTWFVLKLLQTVCLLVAIWMVRDRPSRPLPSSPRVKVALIAMAIVCGALLIAAVHDQWSSAIQLVESGFVKDRTPFVVWLVFLALGPVGLTLGLSTRRSYGSRVSLATFATLATVSYIAEALVRRPGVLSRRHPLGVDRSGPRSVGGGGVVDGRRSSAAGRRSHAESLDAA